MAASSNADVVTFSVTVNQVCSDGKEIKTMVKNAIRQFSKYDTWFRVFRVVTENKGIPNEVDEHFEKSSTIVVSRKPPDSAGSDEHFTADAYDQLKILSDFDKHLKYVTISVTFDQPKRQEELQEGVPPQSTINAHDVLMGAASWAPKAMPKKVPTDKPRFTGMSVRH